MNGLRFVCLGVGDAFSARWYSSCLAVESGGTWLLVDCPHPIRKILREAGEACGERLDIDVFSAVVLTHLHADHASGLEGLGFYSHFILKRPAVVFTHELVRKPMLSHHLATISESIRYRSDGSPPVKPPKLADFYDVRPLSETSKAEFGPFTIECRRTIHQVPTFALKICAGGRCLGMSADTIYDPALIDWLSEADLIVHETNYGPHTPYEKLAALPEDLRRKMRLIHYPDNFDMAGSVIEPLVPGRKYEV
jgi:ribonuclease BN (tRNA processing enzyme)